MRGKGICYDAGFLHAGVSSRERFDLEFHARNHSVTQQLDHLSRLEPRRTNPLKRVGCAPPHRDVRCLERDQRGIQERARERREIR